jgi:GntR family transcriptional regulator/MocR family aminotransferase
MRVAGVPVDADGLVVDALPRRARMVYLTPSHQYPLGMTMALERRIALIEWAERNDAAIIEDDYDSEFRFGGRPIEPLRTLDRTGRVAYVGSFSKTLLPTLRLGFVVTPPSLREAVQKAKYLTDWHTPLFLQRALARFIDSGGFARHVRRMNRVYRARHELITDLLATNFADQLEIVPSAVGIHIGALARRASVEDIRNVARRASTNGVEIHVLSVYACAPPGRAGIVLGYGAIPLEGIPAAMRILQAAFEGADSEED